MSTNDIPHLHNQPGVSEIFVSSKKFKCIGALPPLDHPHIYMEMGNDSAIVCPYCGTIYRHDTSIDGVASPASTIYNGQI